jgi:hypothetical protein
VTIKTKKAQFLSIKLIPTLATNLNTLNMKKYYLLSIGLIIGLSSSSLAQTQKCLTQDKDKNSATFNSSTLDSKTISNRLQIKPYKFNSINLNVKPPTVVIDGKISENGYAGLAANDIQSISVLKGEKASYVYSDQNGAGVIVITTKKKAIEAKVEKELNKK